jgi:hypothetical protein
MKCKESENIMKYRCENCGMITQLRENDLGGFPPDFYAMCGECKTDPAYFLKIEL